MTADELVARIRDVGKLPARADTTDQKILDEVNAEFQTRLVPLFHKLRSGFFRDHDDIAIVANQVQYDIPSRAFGSGIEQVKYVDADGNEVIDLKEINTRQIGRLAPQWWLVSDTTATTPSSFYFDQGYINLSPVVTVAGATLRVYYSRRPGKLVLLAGGAVGLVASSSLHNVNVGATTPSGFTTGALIDVMAGTSPFKLRAKDAVISGVDLVGNITCSGTDLSAVVAGDYVTLAKQAYIPEIPEDWHELLVDYGVAKMHHKLGNQRAEADVRGAAKEKLDLLISATSPRGKGTPRVVFPSW